MSDTLEPKREQNSRKKKVVKSQERLRLEKFLNWASWKFLVIGIKLGHDVRLSLVWSREHRRGRR